jgi:hypothetical protein
MKVINTLLIGDIKGHDKRVSSVFSSGTFCYFRKLLKSLLLSTGFFGAFFKLSSTSLLIKAVLSAGILATYYKAICRSIEASI